MAEKSTMQGRACGADSPKVDLTKEVSSGKSSGANKGGMCDGGVLQGAEMAQPLYH